MVMVKEQATNNLAIHNISHLIQELVCHLDDRCFGNGISLFASDTFW